MDFVAVSAASGWQMRARRDTLAANRFFVAQSTLFAKGAFMILLARSFLSASLAAALLTAPGAYAEGVDLSRASCGDFTAMSESDQTQLSLWLAGYFAGSAMRPMLDLEKIAAAPAGLAAHCAKSPQAPLVSGETRAIFMTAP